MSETELRGALVAALSPLWRAQGRASVLDNPGLHNDLALAEAKLQAILASIPAEPEQARWSVGGQSGMAPGVLDTLYAEPEQADAVAGLGAERIEAVLRAHQWRSMTFSCSCGLVFATGHIEHVAALIARLAPARDDTSGGAS